jgi:DNA polymerase elongation subunit (family B)
MGRFQPALCTHPMTDKQRILLLDIETTPHTAFVWGLFNQTVSPSQLAKHGRTICWAAQWYGEKSVSYMDEREGHLKMIQGIHARLQEADIVITYNGSSFDIPTLSNAFVQYGLSPLPKFKHIDLYHVVRKRFRLASNKLEHVVSYLGLGGKVSHKGFPLWLGVMAGDAACWRVMKKYNIHDVTLLLAVYQKLRPWVPNHPDVTPAVRMDHCPSCGSDKLHSRGERYTKEFSIARYQCQKCHSWSDGKRKRRTAA